MSEQTDVRELRERISAAYEDWCRPTRSPEEREALIQAGAAKMGIDPADHPARNWVHCARCGTWHRPEVFEVRAS